MDQSNVAEQRTLPAKPERLDLITRECLSHKAAELQKTFSVPRECIRLPTGGYIEISQAAELIS